MPSGGFKLLDTAEVKIAAMKAAGFIVAETPAHLGEAVLKAIAS